MLLFFPNIWHGWLVKNLCAMGYDHQTGCRGGASVIHTAHSAAQDIAEADGGRGALTAPCHMAVSVYPHKGLISPCLMVHNCHCCDLLVMLVRSCLMDGDFLGG